VARQAAVGTAMRNEDGVGEGHDVMVGSREQVVNGSRLFKNDDEAMKVLRGEGEVIGEDEAISEEVAPLSRYMPAPRPSVRLNLFRPSP